MLCVYISIQGFESTSMQLAVLTKNISAHDLQACQAKHLGDVKSILIYILLSNPGNGRI